MKWQDGHQVSSSFVVLTQLYRNKFWLLLWLDRCSRGRDRRIEIIDHRAEAMTSWLTTLISWHVTKTNAKCRGILASFFEKVRMRCRIMATSFSESAAVEQRTLLHSGVDLHSSWARCLHWGWFLRTEQTKSCPAAECKMSSAVQAACGTSCCSSNCFTECCGSFPSPWCSKASGGHSVGLLPRERRSGHRQLVCCTVRGGREGPWHLVSGSWILGKHVRNVQKGQRKGEDCGLVPFWTQALQQRHCYQQACEPVLLYRELCPCDHRPFTKGCRFAHGRILCCRGSSRWRHADVADVCARRQRDGRGRSRGGRGGASVARYQGHVSRNAIAENISAGDGLERPAPIASDGARVSGQGGERRSPREPRHCVSAAGYIQPFTQPQCGRAGQSVHHTNKRSAPGAVRGITHSLSHRPAQSHRQQNRSPQSRSRSVSHIGCFFLLGRPSPVHIVIFWNLDKRFHSSVSIPTCCFMQLIPCQ